MPADVQPAEPNHTPTLGGTTRVLGPTRRAVLERPATERYFLGELIAEGGMGAVFRATDLVLCRPIAIKVIQRRLLDRPDALVRFEEEARVMGRLQHPGIPPVHDLGTLADGRLFLAMKLIEGRTFSNLLDARSKPLDNLSRHLQVFEAICQTMAYVHEQGVIHRDLKPGNVMVGSFGEVQVMDWGLAKILASGDREVAGEEASNGALTPAARLEGATLAGAILGTPTYMPPEQARGQVDLLDCRTDVFALGSILCEILTGQPAYPGENSLEAAQQGELGDAEQRLATCGADADLVTLALRCLARDREQRPDNADVVARAIAAHRQGVEERLRAAERERHVMEARAIEERKRRGVQGWLAVSGLVLLVVVGVAWWWIERLASDARREIDRQAHEYRREQERQEQETQAAVSFGLAETARFVREDRLDSAEATLSDVEERLGPDGRDDLRQLLKETRRHLTMARLLDRIFEQRWAVIDGQIQPAAVCAGYDRAFAEYGLSPVKLTTAAFLAGLRGSPIASRLRRSLEDWMLLSPRGEERTVLVALLNADDGDDLRRQVREAFDRENSEELAGILPRVAPEQLNPRLVLLLAERWQLPLADRVRLVRDARDTYPDDIGIVLILYDLVKESGHVSHPALDVEAEGAARAILFGRPRSASAWNALGIIQRDRGLADKAVRAFQQAIKFDPKFGGAYYNLGVALHDRSDLEAAERAYHKAIELLPDHSMSYNNLGNILRTRGDNDGAIEAFRKAVEKDPQLSLAYTNLGSALREKGDVDGAIESFRTALKIHPNYPEANCNLGLVLQRRGLFTESVEKLARGHELGSRSPRWNNPSEYWLNRARRLEELNARLPRVLEGAEEPATGLELGEYASLCGENLERYSEALTFLERAVARDRDLFNKVPFYRIVGAHAAIHAASGEGVHPPSTQDHPALRKQALAWLRADVEHRLATAPNTVVQHLRDSQFAPVRDRAALAALPEDERQQWQGFWNEVQRIVASMKR
jgi:tetratricopeptide (TPR) repeat protein